MTALPPWSTAALAAAFFIGVHYLTLRAASGRVGDAAGALLVELSAAVGLFVMVLWFRGTAQTELTTVGAVWSVASGLCISGAMILLFTALRLGGPVAATGPIVLGGGVALSALVAPFLFGEPMTLRRALGVLLALAGLALLATDRG